MTRTKQLCALTSIVFLAGACSDISPGGKEQLFTSQNSLQSPGTTPIPFDPSTNQTSWGGSQTELIVADALASCAFVSEQEAVSVYNFTDYDPYLAHVWSLMGSTSCGVFSVVTLGDWVVLRRNSECNKDPSTGANLGVPLKKSFLKEKLSFPPGAPNPWGEAGRLAAQMDLRSPAMNLCIAQRMRAIAPGAAGGEALLFSAADQRELLEITRERAQIAMLQYAVLNRIFASNPTAEPGPGQTIPPRLRLRFLQHWSSQPENQQDLARMGRDFSSAIQLHAILSREIAELFGRSSSARERRDGNPASLPEEFWGSGSWRQRALASLYGGDPLAASEGAPWRHPLNKEVPGEESNFPAALYRDWPDKRTEPFQSIDTRDPQADLFLSLAKSCDGLQFFTQAIAGEACESINRPFSADAIYRITEACLRNRDCYEPLSPPPPSPAPVCKQFTASQIPPVLPGNPAQPPDLDSFVLWSKYRITPGNALSMVERFSSSLEPIGSCDGIPPRMAMNNLVGTANNFPFVGVNPHVQTIRLDKDFHTRERHPLQNSGHYTGLAPFGVPFVVYTQGSAEEHGLARINSFGPNPVERMRLQGSITALAIAGQSIEMARAAAGQPTQPTTAAFVNEAASALDVIYQNVGELTFSIQPLLTPANTPDNAYTLNSVSTTPGKHSWQILLSVDSADPFWATSGTSYFLLGAIPYSTASSNLILYPDSKIYGKTLTDLLQQPGAIAGFLLEDQAAPKLRYAQMNLQDLDRWTFFVAKVFPDRSEFRLLADNLPLGPFSTYAQTVASGGTLGQFADKLMRKSAVNPARPAYDGFGYNAGWVPPSSPQLFGGSSGEDSVTHYLQQARSAAQSATQAVKDSFDSMLFEATDEAQLAAATTKSKEVSKQIRASLCGNTGTACDVSMGSVPLSFSQAFWASIPQPTEIDGVVYETLKLLDGSYSVAKIVQESSGNTVTPAFSEFSGGALQSIFIEQWTALRQMTVLANELIAQGNTANGYLNAAQAQFQFAQSEAEYNCSPTAIAASLVAGTSVTVGVSVGLTGPLPTTNVSASVSFSPGPLVAQLDKCRQLKNQLTVAQAEAILPYLDAMQAFAVKKADVFEARARLLQAISQGAQQIQEADRAVAQLDLELNEFSQGQTTSFELYRRYHSYDTWRAKALLDDARRYAVAARRAIEARFVVDLSMMNAPEPFVASPATWADSVYEYDLSLPAAVGLSVGPQDPAGIYPNKLVDYIDNLQRFVDGYAIQRPTAVAHEDVEVLSLPGLHLQPTAEGEPPNQSSGAWTFACKAGEPFFSLAPVQTPGAAPPPPIKSFCEGQTPRIARLQFILDPWGRSGGFIAQEPFKKRHNARWTRLAVNLVGTGLKDCQLAEDPQGCYAASFLPFDLTHLGPSWITDANQIWQALDISKGRIEGGKALAGEQWFDPIADTWEKPFVSSITRFEFSERPFGGTYQLDLHLGPEVDIERLERIQILVGSTYWVQQQ